MTILVGRPLNWAITATAGSGFLLFGYDQGVMSGLLTGYAFTRTFPEIDTTNGGGGSSSLQGTVVAIYEIGCFFGAIFCLLVGERLGRRRCIMIGCVVLSIGAALQAAAFGIPQMIPQSHKKLTIIIIITDGMSFIANDAQFRFPLALQILFAVVTFLGVLVLPESPRWLIAHDRHDEARHVLWAVERDARSISETEPKLERNLAEIQAAIREEREAANAGSFRMMFKNGDQKFFYRTMLGIGGQFMQQLSGINLITYYAPVIFQESVGMTHSLSLLLAGFNGIAYFFSSLIPIWIIDRLGRRKLMLFAAAGQCACMAVLAGTVSNGSVPAGIVAIVMLFLFNFFFAVGLLAIPWLLPAEYAPLAIRTRAAALATASNWIFTFLVVEITPVSIRNIGWRTYVYFCVFNAFFVPLIYFFYPETRNLSLEQIDRLFTGGKVQLYWKASMGTPGEGGTGIVDEKDSESGSGKVLRVENKEDSPN
ncbi:hexose transporter [Colletotrichum higginsianum]|nr:hexose transporter [Colletotrichum higginsianum]